MSRPDFASGIDDEAAGWAIRAEADDLDDQELERLEAWLDADSRHRGAFLRAQAGLSYVDRSRVFAGGDAAADDTRTRFVMPPTRRQLLCAGGGVAAAAAGVGGVILAQSGGAYQTALGEIRNLPLADGSQATINTASRIGVAFSPHLRAVHLDHGEVWFQVAKDASRPFLLRTGRVRVQAVGTAFSVRRSGAGAEVMVTEGVVKTWMADGREPVLHVAAGDSVYMSDAAEPKIVAASVEIDRKLAWRDGRIILDGETLADAAQEFNRYNRVKLFIEDEQLSRQKFVGFFRTNQPESFARAVAITTGAKLTHTSNSIQLSLVAKT